MSRLVFSTFLLLVASAAPFVWAKPEKRVLTLEWSRVELQLFRLSTEVCSFPTLEVSLDDGSKLAAADHFLIRAESAARAKTALSGLGIDVQTRASGSPDYSAVFFVGSPMDSESRGAQLWRALLTGLRDGTAKGLELTEDFPEKIAATEFISACSSCLLNYVEARPLEPVSGTSAREADQDWWLKAVGAGPSKLDCKNIKVAIVDSGASSTAPELMNSIRTINGAYGFDAVDGGNPDPDTGSWHGTMMAEVIGGEKNGICKNVELVPIRVFNSNESRTTECALHTDIAEGLHYAIKQSIRIINFSLVAIPREKSPLFKAFEAVSDSGSLLIAAAGQSGRLISSMHAQRAYQQLPLSLGLPNIIGVTSTATYNSREVFGSGANHSACLVHLAAPDTATFSSCSPCPDSDGTSVATAYVAAAAAAAAAAAPPDVQTSSDIQALATYVSNRLLGSSKGLDDLKCKTSTGGRLNLSDLVNMTDTEIEDRLKAVRVNNACQCP